MDEDEFGTRRPRSRNWNTSEKFFLFEHVKNRFDIITDPRKEAAFINAKRRVWEQIYQAIAKEYVGDSVYVLYISLPIYSL